jgi:hypothetical protein
MPVMWVRVFVDKGTGIVKNTHGLPMQNTTDTPSINATLSITMDPSILCMIQDGYKEDECKKLIASTPSMLRVSTANGLWYIGDWLLVPQFCTIWEDLF